MNVQLGVENLEGMLAQALKSVRAAGAEIVKCSCTKTKVRISHQAAVCSPVSPSLPCAPRRMLFPPLVASVSLSPTGCYRRQGVGLVS